MMLTTVNNVWNGVVSSAVLGRRMKAVAVFIIVVVCQRRIVDVVGT